MCLTTASRVVVGTPNDPSGRESYGRNQNMNQKPLRNRLEKRLALPLNSMRIGRLAALVVGLATVLQAEPRTAGIGGPAQARHSTTNLAELRRAWEHRQRAYPLGFVPEGARARALTQIQQTRPPAPRHKPLVGGAQQWINIGPAPILNGQIAPAGPVSGRVTAIAVDPGNMSHWLIGTAQGGVWETLDAGGTWTPKTDDQASLAVGALAFARSNPAIIYAGTGEPNFAALDDYGGAGLLKSVDGGASWQLLASSLFSGKSFSSIVVDPSNPNTLVASVTHGLAGRGAEAPPTQPGYGVFKSTDGGSTWNQKVVGASTDLKADPGNFNHQVAAATTNAFTPSYQLYRSLDAGGSWTTLSGPWINLGGAGRMQLAISPSNPNTLYVSAADFRDPQNNTNYNRLLGIWRTDTAWAAAPTWTQLPQPQGVGDQVWYDQVISVDPANANVLYFGETPLRKFNGTTWATIGADYDANVNGRFFHPDQHAQAWAGTRLIIGNDGGVWSTADGGATFTNHNSNISITQFYYGSVHPQGRDFAIAGAQDNGSEKWQGANGWTLAGLGDGGETAVSPSNPDNNWVVSLDQLQIVRESGAGQFEQEVFAAGTYNLPNVPFIARLALAPTNENILLTAASILIKTTNFFSASTPDWFQDSQDVGAPITALAFAPSDLSGNTYAFGTSDGQLWLTSTGSGADAVNINAGNAVPGRYVTAVAFHPNNPNILYAALSGFDEGTVGKPGHVFKTGNALSPAPTWVDVSPPVDLPHNALALDPLNPNTIYAGTDLGVWVSTDGAGTWNHMGPEIGMPNVAVFDLKVQPVTGRVFAFTHGRGAFMYDPNAINNPPTIASFSPTNGPVGTSVTIVGTKFNNTTAVQFGGINAAGFSVSSSAQIVAAVPAGALTGPITVITPSGTASSTAGFSVSSMPIVTGFSPSGGNVGARVTISGVNLTGATNVTFSGVSAVFTVASSTQITATVPNGAPTGKVSVSTPQGAAQSAAVFTVTTLPVVSSFSPASAAIGSSVIIQGANFVGVNGVFFNGTPAPNPAVNSDSQITASVPAGATTGPISVNTATGTAQSADTFTVIAAPSITGISPASGSVGTVVTIAGNNFAGATAVTFNGLNADSFSVGSMSQIIATAPSGVTTGPIGVTTPGGTGVSVVAFTALTTPGNDNFASAQVITGTSGTVSGNNTAATKEVQEPNHAGNNGGKSIWYRWTAPVSGPSTFNTQGSTFDTLLAVYTGSSLNTLAQVASNDNIPGTNTSSVSFSAVAGTVYQIAVDGFQGDAGEGGVAPPPASGAVALNWDLSANLSPQISSFSPSSGSVGDTVSISGVNFVGATGVRFNGSAADFTASSDQQLTATVPVGATTGPIQVIKPSGTATSTANFAVGTAPGNDNFVNAQVLSGNAGTLIGSSAGATKEAGEPDHAGNPGGSSVWYVWTAPSTGNWRFDTSGSTFDTLLAVYTGSAVASLSLVASNDDSGGAVTSQLSFDALGGTAYYIAVDGYDGVAGNIVLNWAFTGNLPAITGFTPPSGGAGTAVTINGANFADATAVRFSGVSTPAFTVTAGAQIIATVPAGAGTGPISVTTSNGTAQSATSFIVGGNAPTNDNFAQRTVIAGSVVTATGSNVGATKEPNEPAHAGNPGGASVWWTWTAPANGTYAITTRGSSFDTILGVYVGASVSSLALVAANDDGLNMGTASLVSFAANAGTSYQIAVDGYNGASGDIVLSVYPAVTPQDVYFTGFDLFENYSTFFTLAGQNGWSSFGAGQNGVVYDYFYDFSQQAYVGVSSPVLGTNLFVWQPLNFTPDTNTRPVVLFSTYMEIVDSSNSRYDDFGWDVFNQNGNKLFFLDFDNNDLGIYYSLNDGAGYHSTNQKFQNGRIYYLEVAMDFARNLWSATLDGNELVRNQPISADATVTLDVGDIDATWLQTSGTFGNNYMLFDDYYVTTLPSLTPRIITPPQGQSVTAGNSANFLVVAASPLPLTYQWQFNGTDLPGATAPVLTLDHTVFGQSGNYSVIVSNAAGVTIGGPAALAVTQLPNLVPYRPNGWSDKIVVATLPGTNDTAVIHPNQDIYVSWAVLNSATNGAITTRFYTQLYLDGALNHTWFTDGLNADFYSFVIGFDLGGLPAGTHTLRLDTDTTDVIAESDKNDNSYTRTFTVSSTNTVPLRLGAPVLTGNGQIQLTLTGVSSLSYEIQASTDLTNWSVLVTLVNSNANGVLQYTDPAATNFNRRFYRGHLLGP